MVSYPMIFILLAIVMATNPPFFLQQTSLPLRLPLTIHIQVKRLRPRRQYNPQFFKTSEIPQGL